MASEYLKNFGTVEFTGSALTLSQDGHAGVTVVSNLAGAQTITLPASAGTGNVYRIFVKTTKTGNLVIQVANATDVMNGALAVTTDAAGVVIPTAATSDRSLRSSTS